MHTRIGMRDIVAQLGVHVQARSHKHAHAGRVAVLCDLRPRIANGGARVALWEYVFVLHNAILLAVVSFDRTAPREFIPSLLTPNTCLRLLILKSGRQDLPSYVIVQKDGDGEGTPASAGVDGEVG